MHEYFKVQRTNQWSIYRSWNGGESLSTQARKLSKVSNLQTFKPSHYRSNCGIINLWLTQLVEIYVHAIDCFVLILARDNVCH